MLHRPLATLLLAVVLAACGTATDDRQSPPDAFPLPPGAAAAVSTPAGLVGRWTAPQPGRTIYRFYAEALPDAGFSDLQLAPGGAAASIRFTDRGGKQWQLDLQPLGGPEDGTLISLGPPRR